MPGNTSCAMPCCADLCCVVLTCRCDKITISPQLLSELQSSSEPLPRKLSPDMTHSQDSRVDSFSADVFNSLHGGDQMAVDKLKQVGVSLSSR
jgi:transaldolase